MAVRMCCFDRCRDAGDMVRYVQTDSSLGLMRPWSSSAWSGSKNPVSMRATPERRMLMATASPALTYSQNEESLMDWMWSRCGSTFMMAFSVRIL